MPEAKSPFDDPFADLFGKLPDPRERRASGEDAPRGTSEPLTPTGGHTPAGGRPLSRREAREAAARQAAAHRVPAEDPRTATRAKAPAPAAPSAAAPAARSVPAASALSSPSVLPVDDADDWPVAAGAATPPPYSRSGESAAPRPAATATLEDLFTGEQRTDSLGQEPPSGKRRKRRTGAWIALGVVLVLLGGIAGAGLWVWNTYEPQIREVMGWQEPKDFDPGLADGEAFVTIASGDTGAPISQSLFDAGVTKTPGAFYDYLIDTGQNPPFVPGVFKLQKQMTSAAALEALLNPANKLENSAQLREGLTVEQSLPILAEGTGLPVEDFQAAVANPADYGVAADSLEGWLFPATYTFDPGASAPEIIRTLVDRTVQSLDAAAVPVDDRQRVLTIASIIQREARFEADFYKVSRVIQNRLSPDNQQTFGKLEMDSTAQYGYGEADGTASTSEEAQFNDNPWNTYVHPGLPIGPISNPGDTAIDAAMHPADGDWLYFVTVNLDTGETVFTSNLADHNRAVAQWQAWCSENPDSGC
ncbi:endolytic transglycosylase MltG [Microbacterium sp. zg.B48]|uniref:endolytic transglycosylase MltG n=1 Tax=Microbacterium sp. zg.B48 TaxID=2969408 RepID=UPI00214ABE43|nr:endolytic transglycosylase MltG [Microbacterium sp. zg.B48]MCR2761997.1 endolytic transglycosylase MltG [Microbacterium sp. zg.B48]